MTRKPSISLPERAKTDDSLRSERRNLDDALQDDRTSAESEADSLIDGARALADEVLRKERAKADQESTEPLGAPAAAVAGERAMADRAVRKERAAADAVVDNDRKGQADALAALLVHERAATDAYLLTERSRSDDAVAHRDDFLGMVAHDVRNLLNLIALSLDAELLRPDFGEPAPHVTASANRIRRYVARMNRLIGDLLDVTSIDAGKLAVEALPGNAATLVAEATKTFEPAALEKGVSLSAEIPPGPLGAVFDHDRMLQVFSNLIANAIKFTPREGRISVRVEDAGPLVRFCVTDTGVGIPAAQREAIFHRFWQVGPNDRRGMGLGLYISKCIVEAHRGRIWAESEPGQGSRFYVTLPASK